MTREALDPVVDQEATLRLLASADLPMTLAWRNHEDSRRWFHSTATIGATQHRDWFAQYLERDDDYMFVLDLAGVPVAQSSLYHVADGVAEFGRLLVDPMQRGRGLSHRTVALTLRVAEEVLRLSQVHLEVKPDNSRAIRTYEAAGFRTDQAHRGVDDSLVMVWARP